MVQDICYQDDQEAARIKMTETVDAVHLQERLSQALSYFVSKDNVTIALREQIVSAIESLDNCREDQIADRMKAASIMLGNYEAVKIAETGKGF